MAEVQEQFSKLAESKSTVSSFHPSNFFHTLLPEPHHPTHPPFLPSSYLIPVATYRRQRPGSTAITWWLRESPLLLLCTDTLAYRNASPPFVASKRTFTSLVSKVKAKVQEFDQTRYAEIFTLFFSSTIFSCHMVLHPHMPPRTNIPLPSHIRPICICSLACQHTGIPPTPLPLILALAQARAQATMPSPLRLC